MVLPVGTASSTSRDSTCVFWLLCTSTTGEEPDTVTDSSSAPTLRSAFTVAVKFDGSSSPSRLKVLNPWSEKVITYTPGRRSTTWYLPSPSVDTVFVFSISTSLATSTVTPGSTAPDASFTVPPIALCARAAAGNAITHTIAANSHRHNLLECMQNSCGAHCRKKGDKCVGKNRGGPPSAPEIVRPLRK